MGSLLGADNSLLHATVGLEVGTFALVLLAAVAAFLTWRQMKRAYLPIVIPARRVEAPMEVTFKGGIEVELKAAQTYSSFDTKCVYLAFCLHNIGSGVAVVRAVDATPLEPDDPPLLDMPALPGLATVGGHLFLGSNEVGYLRLRAFRNVSTEPDGFEVLAEAVVGKNDFALDLVYTDIKGAQLTVTRIQFYWTEDLGRYVSSAIRTWRPGLLPRRELSGRISHLEQHPDVPARPSPWRP